jgi:RHS repeat-associated protein
VGPQSGNFSWSYQVPVPGSLGGATPDVSLLYSSQSVDGMTPGTNNQPSMAGLGWDLSTTAFIERRYKSCGTDGGGAGSGAGDQCWVSDNATISLNGHSTELVGSGGGWRLKDDPNWRVTKYTGAMLNGDNDGEHWVVTSPDGVQYWFGYGTDVISGAYTNSAWTVPVYGNQSGEPCNADTAHWCWQGWRWMLDRVVDPRGNVATYFWSKELNNYGRGGLPSQGTAYVRGGYLDHIQYSAQATAGSPAQYRVDIGVRDRCVELVNCAAPGPATAASYPDTPVDRMCSGTYCTLYSPSFFTTKRLSEITTFYFNGAVFVALDQIQFTFGFPDNGEYDQKLWLQSLQRFSGTVVLPVVRFDSFHSLLWNRADANPGAGVGYMPQYRVDTINDEAAGQILVTYGTPNACSPLPTTFDNNVKDCYPKYYVPDAGAAGFGIFYKYLTTQVISRDGMGGSPDIVSNYVYEDAPAWHYDDDLITPTLQQSWGDWRGHSTVKVTTGAAPEKWTTTRYRYLRGMHGDKLANGGTKSVQVALLDATLPIDDVNWGAGRERDHQILDVGGNEIEGASTDYTTVTTADVGGRTARWVQANHSLSRVKLAAGGVRKAETLTYFDANLQPASVIDYGDTATGVDDRCTVYTYATNTSAYMLAYRATAKLFAGAGCGGTLASSTETYYDAHTNLYDAPTTAFPTRTRVYTGTVWLTTNYGFDAYGRSTWVQDPLGHISSSAYGPTTGIPNYLNATNALSQTTRTDFYVDRSLPHWVTDPRGQIATFHYDPMGRLTEAWATGDVETGPATAKFTYSVSNTSPSWVRADKLQTAATSTYLSSYTYYDSRLKPRETQVPSPAAAGGRIVTATRYDARGNVASVSTPIYDTNPISWGLLNSASPPSQTQTVYDELNRPTDSIFVIGATEQWRTTTGYAGDSTTVSPPVGGDTRTGVDAQGRTVYVDEQNGVAWPRTTYNYDVADRLTSVVDSVTATPHTTMLGYDLAGRKTSMSDPDMGAWTYGFDDAGNLSRQTDARSKQLWFYYDVLNRKTDERKDSLTGPLVATWTYDAAGNTGLLDTATGYDDAGNTYAHRVTVYDGRGRATADQWDISAGVGGAAGTYKQTAGYDAADHVISMRYPADDAGTLGETVNAVYDAFGNPYSLAGTNTYVTSTTLNSIGQMTSQILGSGGTAITRTQGYEPGTLRTSALQAGTGGSTTNLQNYTYAYDAVSNIKSIIDGVDGNQKQCFTYDDRQRVSLAQTANDACTTYNSTRGDNDEYKATWAYDNLGNITQDTIKLGTGTNTTHTHTFDPTHPHAPNNVVGLVLGYDANGNQTSRNGTAVALTWDYGNHMTAYTPLTGTAETNAYDADGNRIRRTTGTTTVLYLGGNIEATSVSGAAPAITKYYTLGGQRIAMRNTTGLYYIVADHLGGANVTYRSDGADTKTQRYYPYGGIRPGPTNTLATDRDFTGQTLDPTSGLTHMGARDYDAATQTFTSADTIAPSAGSKGLNRYSYAFGNPVALTDPTGHEPCEAADGGTLPSCLADWNNIAQSGASGSGVGTTPAYVTQKQRDSSLNDLNDVVRMCASRFSQCPHGSPDDAVGSFGWASGVAYDYLSSLINSGLVAVCGDGFLCPGPGWSDISNTVGFEVFGGSVYDFTLVAYSAHEGFREMIGRVAGGVGNIASGVAVVGWGACAVGLGCALGGGASAVAMAADAVSFANSCSPGGPSGCGWDAASFALDIAGQRFSKFLSDFNTAKATGNMIGDLGGLQISALQASYSTGDGGERGHILFTRMAS